MKEDNVEIHVSDKSDYKTFESVSMFVFTELGGKFTSKLNGLDQRYWDFEISGTTFTLHSDHYLGISIFTENNPVNRDMIGLIKEKFENIVW